MTDHQTSRDGSWRIVGWLIAGQALCMAVGFGLLPSWLLASGQHANELGQLLILTIGASCLLLVAGLWKLQSAARGRKNESDAEALRVREDLVRTQQAVMFGLAHLSESRDPLAGQHLQRMKYYTRELANALSRLPKYQAVVTPEFVRLIETSAMLHDIGKVGVSDCILLKPGELTVAERREMERHPLISSECLGRIEQRLGASNFLQMAHEIALYHHERWDGLGYPFGLRGAAIPLAARIVSIADVYDALSSARVYKDAFPRSQCVDMIRLGAGTQFDPELVQIFLEIEPLLAKFAAGLADNVPVDSSNSEVNGTSMSSDATRTMANVAAEFDNLDELLKSLGVEQSDQKDLVRDFAVAR